jgi:hypothetical protein
MWTGTFWKATAERAIRAFAATLASVWAVGGGILDVRGVDWGSSLSVAAGAALVSVVLSLAAGAGIGPTGSPSMVQDKAAAGEPQILKPVTTVHDPGEERLGRGGYPGGTVT